MEQNMTSKVSNENPSKQLRPTRGRITSRYGFYCISLKENCDVGRKFKNANRKSIEQVDADGQVIKVFDSITQATYEWKVTVSRMSIISNNQVSCGYSF